MPICEPESHGRVVRKFLGRVRPDSVALLQLEIAYLAVANMNNFSIFLNKMSFIPALIWALHNPRTCGGEPMMWRDMDPRF